MAEGDWRPVMHPAGSDTELRVALEEVALGRWMSMRTLLARTDTSRSWATWTYRSQVLAASAAGTDVVEAWADDEPDATATVMLARVASERALRAFRGGHPNADSLWHTALGACRTAVHAAMDNPVPWTCFLALAVIDEDQQAGEHRVKASDPMLPAGPWGLLRRADALDPYNREAYHRMLQYWLSRPDASAVSHADGYARWVLSRAEQPAAAALLMLPVYVRVERWLRLPREALDMHWLNSYAIQDALSAFHGWFALRTEGERSVQDLNYLAHALWAGQQYEEAGRVFQAMGRHITPRPWQFRLADPGDKDALVDQIARCRSQCLSVAESSARTSPARFGRHRHRPAT
ncbi:hypothetical protein [Streptomyces sp. SID1121]|uniref:hypothetical protein n=1 Tax=Streptomyces sp. SID1121 TaxID=3425888 RepID=UPI0040577CA5